MLLWTCLHCSPKSYFKLISWTLLFYGCPCILQAGNTCEQLGCSAVCWLLFSVGVAVSPKPWQSVKAVESQWFTQVKCSQRDSFNGCGFEKNMLLSPFCLPDTFSMGKPCCVLLKQLLSGIVCFFFQVTRLYGACSFLTAVSIIKASASFLRWMQVRTMSLSTCFFVLFIAVLPIIVCNHFCFLLTSGTEATIVSYPSQKGME